jgi:hypothetical protein
MANVLLATLEDILHQREHRQRELKQHQEFIQNLQQSCATSDQTLTQHLVERIKAGETTGDQLLDECIVAFGLMPEYFKNVLAFNQRLIALKDTLCLIHFTWKTRYLYGGPFFGREGEYIENRGYFFGQLSGDSLKIKAEGDVDPSPLRRITVTFPFSRYLGFNVSDFIKAGERKFEPLVIQWNFHEEPSSQSLLAFITKENENTCKVIFEEDFEKHSEICCYAPEQSKILLARKKEDEYTSASQILV